MQRILKYSKTIQDRNKLSQLLKLMEVMVISNNNDIINAKDLIGNRHYKDWTVTERKIVYDRLKSNVVLMQECKQVEQIAKQEITNHDFDIVQEKLRQHAYKLGIYENNFAQLENHLHMVNQEIYNQYIEDLIIDLQKHHIQFDQDKFDIAKVQGTKASKFLAIIAIYDLFDSIVDNETFGRHNNNYLKKIFGINGILDTINDLRITLDISNQNKLIGGVIDKVPKTIRIGLVKAIDNPIVGGITFIANAWQFGYSINEIIQGDHNVLNYYWTGSSGVKLATPISSVSRILKVLIVPSKILSKVSLMTTVIDIALMTGMKIHERLKVIEHIASRIPLSDGEKRELFFANIIKFFTGRDIEKEYAENDKIRGYLDIIKTNAKILLEQDNSIAAVVQYVAGIEEKYHDIITGSELLEQQNVIHQPSQKKVILCSNGHCSHTHKLYNYSYTPMNSYKLKSNLSLLDLAQTLPLRPHTLDTKKTIKGFTCSITPKSSGCHFIVEDDEINDREIYVIDPTRKYIPYITRDEYENWRLRVVSVPSGSLQSNSHCNIINPERYKELNLNNGIILNDQYWCDIVSMCNIDTIHKDCQKSFVFSGEIQPFIFTNIKKADPYNIKTKYFPDNSILYFSGPKILVAAANYPAIMYISENMKAYYGSKLHETIAIINNIPEFGVLKGGEVEKNLVLISDNVNNVILNIHLESGELDSVKDNRAHGYIYLEKMYNYLSYSAVNQNIITHCKTRYINAAGSEMGNHIYQLKFSTTIDSSTYNDSNCTSEDYEIRVIHNKDQHYTGPKKIIFLLDRHGGNAKIIYHEKFLNNKDNIDVISLSGINDITKQSQINYDVAENKFNLLIKNAQNVITCIKVNSFNKLIIQASQHRQEQIIIINDKLLLHILEDMKYQIFSHNKLGTSIRNNESNVIATILVSQDITSVSQIYDAYKITKDIMNSNSLAIPIETVTLVQHYISVPMSKVLIGGIYSNTIMIDFHGNNDEYGVSHIICVS